MLVLIAGKISRKLKDNFFGARTWIRDNREFRDYDEMYPDLGWPYVVEGDDFFIAHSGGGPGFAVNMRLYPKRDFGMVVLANGTYLDSKRIFDLVASLDR